jgi:hypothetical protein
MLPVVSVFESKSYRAVVQVAQISTLRGENGPRERTAPLCSDASWDRLCNDVGPAADSKSALGTARRRFPSLGVTQAS